MAGLGTKLWTSGEVVTAAGVNGYLQDQVIGTYASTTARDAAFGGAGEPTLSEGMFAYTTDTNTLWLYSGATNGWVNVLGSDIGQQALSNRNVIINGAMQVAQRATSTASITTSGYYTADRWLFEPSNMGTHTMSVESDAPTGSGFRKSIKVLCTTADAAPAAGDLLDVQTRLEGQNLQQFLKGTSAAKPFTVSFWAKSNVTGTYVIALRDLDNSRAVSASYSISVSETWEKKTITFPADTTGAFDNDNGNTLLVLWGLGAGTNFTSGTLQTTWGSYTAANLLVGQTNLAAATNNYWQITGVQLEAGAVATPFEFEDFGVTLAKCQRYYFRSVAGSPQQFATGMAYATNGIYVNIPFPVTMRSSPTALETTGTASNYAVTLNSTASQALTSIPTFNAASLNSAGLLAVSTTGNLVQGDATFLVSATAGAYLGFSAEL